MREERLMKWRRLVIRYEHKAENFLGLIHVACIIILLRALRDGF